MKCISSECGKISSLPVFYVNEKFTHQVIYLNTKSSIFLSKGDNLHIKFVTLLSVANFFNESTYLLIKFLALISSFLYLYQLYRIEFFPTCFKIQHGRGRGYEFLHSQRGGIF